jgi:hypothetical protein
MTDDARNGSRPSIHVIDDTKDFGVEDTVDAAMAGRMAAKALRQQALAEREIDGLLEDVRSIERGKTEWQLHVKRGQQQILDEVNAIKLTQQKVLDEVHALKSAVVYSKYVWPTLTFMGLVVAGTCLTELILKVVHH